MVKFLIPIIESEPSWKREPVYMSACGEELKQRFNICHINADKEPQSPSLNDSNLKKYNKVECIGLEDLT